MQIEEAQSLKIGDVIEADFSAALDGVKCIANGPLVFMHGDRGEVVHVGDFPTVTAAGIVPIRKYVLRFPLQGGLRTLLSPDEIQKPFRLLKGTDNA